MTRSTDPEMDAALEVDASNLLAMGEDPGAELEDFFDDRDPDEEDGLGFGEEDCGRWLNGRLTHSCMLLGTEDCDFECPLRGSL